MSSSKYNQPYQGFGVFLIFLSLISLLRALQLPNTMGGTSLDTVSYIDLRIFAKSLIYGFVSCALFLSGIILIIFQTNSIDLSTTITKDK